DPTGLLTLHPLTPVLPLPIFLFPGAVQSLIRLLVPTHVQRVSQPPCEQLAPLDPNIAEIHRIVVLIHVIAVVYEYLDVPLQNAAAEVDVAGFLAVRACDRCKVLVQALLNPAAGVGEAGGVGEARLYRAERRLRGR